MAYALVGTIGVVSVGTAGATVTPAWGTGENRTAGNLLLLWVASTGSATLPGAISGWSIGLQKAGSTCSVSLYYKVATGSDTAPTVPAISSDLHNARIGEFSGNTATPKDQSGSNSGTTSPLTATAGAASGAVGELLVGVGVMRYSAAGTKTISATSNHVTSLTETQNGGTSTASHYEFAYGTTNSISGADTYAQTYTTTSIGGCAVELVTFLLPASQNPQPTAGSMTLTGATSTISTPVLTQPTTGSMSLTGAVPTVTVGAVGVTVQPTAASLTATPATPAVSAAQTYAPSAVSLTLSAATPPVATPRASQPSAVSLTLAGATPAVLTPRVSQPTAASASFSPATPAVLTPQVSLPSAAALASSFATPVVLLGLKVLPTAAGMVLAGIVPAVVRPIVVQPGGIALTVALTTPSVWAPRVSLPGALLLSVVGSVPVVITGGAATLFVGSQAQVVM